jgi:hypothetical protein
MQYQYVPSKEQRFATVNGPRDLIWAILFVAHLIAVFGLCGYGIYYTNTNTQQTGGMMDSSLVKIYEVSATCAGVAIFLALIWITLLRRMAHYVVWFTLLFTVVMCFVIAAMGYIYLSGGGIYFAIIFVIVGLINALFIYLWRKRIPFATQLLTVVAEVTNIYPSTVIVSFVSLLIQTIWITIWVLTIVGAQQLNENNNLSNVLVFILLVSFYWTSQVIGNTVHVTCAGTFASWYFLGGTSAMQENPTLKSLKRATTTSFGSICLGSLLIAVIQALRNMVRNSGNSRNFMAIILTCLLACIENIIRFFNKYAFTQVAIYGKTFCQAAKDTFHLMSERGVDAIVNDTLTGKVMGIICFISAVICGTVGAIWGYVDQEMNSYYLYYLTGILGFLIGLILVGQVLFVIDSGITTIFVCFAEDPQALNSTKPSLYQLFRETYEERSPILFQT